jgi:transcriptional regulator with XRE-family HTH domain
MAQTRDDKLLFRIALVLKELREQHDVSQEDVYIETKIHIGRIETCKSNLTVSTLSVLLKFFRIDMSEFFERVEGRGEATREKGQGRGE